MFAIRPGYDWLLKQSGKRHAAWTLFLVALAEASVFPIPPDILLIPMALAQRQRAYRLALVCTLGSVIGAMIGYAIGAMAMVTIGQWIVETYHLQHAFQAFHDQFNKWGVWIILAKGLTPIPFKLVTIASGVAHLNFLAFVLSAAVTRAARFFLVATLIRRFGAPVQLFIERYLPWVALAILAALLFGFWIVLR